MPVIEQKTTNKNKVDFDLNRLDKSKTTIFSKYPEFSAKKLTQEQKPSIRKALATFREAAKQLNANRQKTKYKDREVSL